MLGKIHSRKNPDKKAATDDEDGMPVPTSKPKRKESPEVKVKKLDKLVDAEVMGTDLDKMFVGEVGSILNSDVSEEEKNDSILEVMGGVGVCDGQKRTLKQVFKSYIYNNKFVILHLYFK